MINIANMKQVNPLVRIAKGVPADGYMLEVSVSYMNRNQMVPDPDKIWPLDLALAIMGEMIIPCPSGNCWRLTTDHNFREEEKKQMLDAICDVLSSDDIDQIV